MWKLWENVISFEIFCCPVIEMSELVRGNNEMFNKNTSWNPLMFYLVSFNSFDEMTEIQLMARFKNGAG